MLTKIKVLISNMLDKIFPKRIEKRRRAKMAARLEEMRKRDPFIYD